MLHNLKSTTDFLAFCSGLVPTRACGKSILFYGFFNISFLNLTEERLWYGGWGGAAEVISSCMGPVNGANIGAAQCGTCIDKIWMS